jgi:ribosomal protein S18 acetylase RimI-like enzyme
MGVTVEVRRDPGVVPLLEPLWRSLLQHQGALEGVPALQDAEASWVIEREVYSKALRHPDAFVALAKDDRANVVGYAFVKVRSGPDEMWRTGDRISDLETLSVLPEHRGGGIGSLIMDTVLAELSVRGIRDFQLGVLAANESALRFYARFGLTPRFITLSNFGQEA